MTWLGDDVIPQEYFDALPKGARHKVAALWEGMGSRIEELEWWRSAWGATPPPGGIRPSNIDEVQPSVMLTIRWHADHKKKAREDLDKIEDRLSPSTVSAFRFDGKEEELEAEHMELTEFSEGTHDVEGLASVTLTVPYRYYSTTKKWWERGEDPPIKHARDMARDGPQFRLVEKWNRQGVRCMLVERWVPTPAEWEDEGVIDYWTGYVYAGEEFDVVAMPEKVGSGGVLVPKVTWPEDRAEESGPNGWIGWDNNIETGRDGPEEPEMTEEEAVEATNLLAKAVHEVWLRDDVDPAEVYG